MLISIFGKSFSVSNEKLLPKIEISVPLALFEAKSAQNATTYLELAQQANTIANVNLFGGKRKIDFTLFKPRGHYIETERLQRYFRAMNWLAHIDLSLVKYDEDGKPHLNIKHIAAAALLQNAITKAKQRTIWQEFDNLISAFIGQSDNTTLSDLERFLADAKIETAGDVFKADKAQLLRLLTSRDYGQQQIIGQLLTVNPNNPKPLPPPISFMLMGQRFAIDSYIMSNLVHDRLLVKGRKVPRALPSPLDVMYALGNDRAKIHLRSELEQYLRQKFFRHDPKNFCRRCCMSSTLLQSGLRVNIQPAMSSRIRYFTLLCMIMPVPDVTLSWQPPFLKKMPLNCDKPLWHILGIWKLWQPCYKRWQKKNCA
jgi:hypothetical protein